MQKYPVLLISSSPGLCLKVRGKQCVTLEATGKVPKICHKHLARGVPSLKPRLNNLRRIDMKTSSVNAAKARLIILFAVAAAFSLAVAMFSALYMTRVFAATELEGEWTA